MIMSENRRKLGHFIYNIDKSRDFFNLVMSVCENEELVNYMLKYLDEHPNANDEDVIESIVRMRYEYKIHPNCKR